MPIGEDKKTVLKRLIKKLHEGADPEKVKDEFKEFLGGVSPTDVAGIEEELIREGLPREEIRLLCDVHLALFKESLERQEVKVPPGHPLHTLMEEHERIKEFLEELKKVVGSLDSAAGFDAVRDKLEALRHIADHLMEVENHNVREENVLFPYLEKHGIREPPAVMWSEHYDLRERKKQLIELADSPAHHGYGEFVGRVKDIADQLTRDLSSHIYKENNILYPTALKVIPEEEWREIKAQCDDLGYCCFTPEHEWPASAEEEAAEALGGETMVFETGSLSSEEAEAVFNSLPFDITFVDRDDAVRYYSQGAERIFPRTRAIIGRRVQQCHPEKSIHVVNQILDDFRTGTRKSAVFWIDRNGRKIYIRYFPVHNRDGEYLGCVEVTQDVTDIQKIEGEKRLIEQK